jgi:phosphoribosylanthranilate isomerase
MTKIKICGITNLEDALAAAEGGADYLGFNFYPASPRFIQPAHCAAITRRLEERYPQVGRVGVFVNAGAEQVRAILDECHLQLAQLHGDEPPDLLAALAGRAFKAWRGAPGAEIEAYARLGPAAPAFLLDAAATGVYGGSGNTGDWEAAGPLAQRYRIFLAGGLKPENVAEAIRRVRPWGVDTASGVEERPGVKDREKLEKFIEAVRNSDG